MNMCSLMAQSFEEPQDIKTNPSIYPPPSERERVMEWARSPDNYKVKIYSKVVFDTYTADDKCQIEGYGYYIVYQGNYLRLSEIQTYESNKGNIISRDYTTYKSYIHRYNQTRYFELFGN